MLKDNSQLVGAKQSHNGSHMNVSDATVSTLHESKLSLVAETMSCFLDTRSGSLSEYSLRFDESMLQVLSRTSQKVKSSLNLSELHAREVPKQQIKTMPEPKEGKENNFENQFSFSEESKEVGQAALQSKGVYQKRIFYPIKLQLSKNRSRFLFFESRKKRAFVLHKILRAQGFKD